MTKKEKDKRYREKHKEKISIKAKEYRNNNKEKLRIKAREYREKNREKIYKTERKWRARHKKETTMYSNKYNENNREKINKANRLYCKNNPEKVTRRHKKYREVNKGKEAKYMRDRRHNDPQFALVCKIRSTVKNMFSLTGNRKNIRTESLLGAPFQIAKDYIFNLGYDSDKHDLDHIIPLYAFDLLNPDHLKIAAHYTNLQPLEPIYNRNIKQNLLYPDWKNRLVFIGNNADINPESVIKHIENKLFLNEIKIMEAI